MVFKLLESLVFIFLTFLIVLSVQDYIVLERKILSFAKEKERNLEKLELYSNYLFGGFERDADSLQLTIATEVIDATESKVLKLLKTKLGKREVEIIISEISDFP